MYKPIEGDMSDNQMNEEQMKEYMKGMKSMNRKKVIAGLILTAIVFGWFAYNFYSMATGKF